MTAKASISKNRLFSMKYFKHSLRSYWWLGVIAAIVYGIAGPLVLWMLSANQKSTILRMNEDPAGEMAELVHQWFYLDGVISYYIIAMFLAVVFALVTWSYLHSKKQINFYHSMPISRPALFLNNVLLGIAINIGPMLIMYVLSLLIGVGYGTAAAIPWNIAFIHPLRIFLFFMLSYSLAVLAAQLTGTVLTQFGMSAVLHFGPVCFLLVATLSMDIFLDTFNSTAAYDKIWGFSPLTNFLYWVCDKQSVSYYVIMSNTLQGLGLKWILEIIAITVIAFVAAFIAYQKRSSENAGVPLIYKFTQPIVEFLLMFCIAALAGITFMEMSGKIFFIVGLVIFAVLTHMFCQVIYLKDFKAMFASKKTLVGFTVVLLLFFGSMYTDICGYDNYVPKSDKVSAIKIDLRTLESSSYRYSYNPKEDNFVYTDANDIELLLSIADRVTESGHYYHNSRLHDNEYLDNVDYDDTISLYYTYVTSSGREIEREYIRVPIAEFKQDFLALYNQKSFKQNVYASLLNVKAKDVRGFSITNIAYQEFFLDTGVDTEGRYAYTYSSGYRDWDDVVMATTEGYATAYTVENSVSTQVKYNYKGNYSDKYTEELLNALKLDVVARQTSDFPLIPMYTIDMELFYDDQGRNSYRYEYAVYDCDEHTLAVIAKIAADGEIDSIDYNHLAQNISSLDIYEGELSDNGINVRDLASSYFLKKYDDDIEQYGFTKTRTVTDKAEIARIISQTMNYNSYYYATNLVDLQQDIFIAVHMRDIVDGNMLFDLGLLVPEGVDI